VSKVKIFLRFFNIFFIIILTGCAGQRYHKAVAPVTSAQAPLPVFAWPIEGGRRVGRFGGREEGVTLKGVVLEGSEGQEVRSASDGNVVYADESMRGYGRTLIVEHANGYSSVYARISDIFVSVGDRVRKGQPLARVGRGGKGSEPQVYFEVRQNSKPVDPELVLR